jgi:hypothetical protein
MDEYLNPFKVSSKQPKSTVYQIRETQCGQQITPEWFVIT